MKEDNFYITIMSGLSTLIIVMLIVAGTLALITGGLIAGYTIFFSGTLVCYFAIYETYMLNYEKKKEEKNENSR